MTHIKKRLMTPSVTRKWRNQNSHTFAVSKIECDHIHTYIPQHAGGKSPRCIFQFTRNFRKDKCSLGGEENYGSGSGVGGIDSEGACGNSGDDGEALDLAVVLVSWCPCFPKLSKRNFE